MSTKTKAILFDLDGTLWDSSQAVVDSWNEIIETLPDFHKKITLEDMQSLMGKTMDDIAYSYFTTVSRERALEIMQLCMDYENNYIERHGGILFEKLEETLKELSKRYFLAIVSNCQTGYIEAFLSYHGLEDYFEDHECFGNTLLPKSGSISVLLERNEINPEDAIYLGDVEGDYVAATDADVRFVHAGYGYGLIPQADYRIESFEELIPMADQLLGE